MRGLKHKQNKLVKQDDAIEFNHALDTLATAAKGDDAARHFQSGS